MDVGLLCQGWVPDRGGIERHTLDLATELGALGHGVHVLCLDGRAGRSPYSVETRERGGVCVRRMAYRYHDQRRLLDLVRNPRAERVVADWLADTPLDVVHAHHLTGFGLGALEVIAARHPLVLTLHDYWILCPRGQLLAHDGSFCARPLPERCGPCLGATWPHLEPDEPDESEAAGAEERTRAALALLEGARRLVVPSRAAAAVFERAGLAAGRCTVIEHGVDVAGLARDVERLRRGRGPGAPVRIGVLGTVLPSKGVLELIEAFGDVAGSALALEVHGDLPPWHGDASYAERVRTTAARDARVSLQGPYEPEQLATVLAGLDAVAAPALWEEVFGLSVREARAVGLPVLVADRGGLPQALDGGSRGAPGSAPGGASEGRVLPPGDRRAWARALEQLAGGAQLCAPRPGRPRTRRDMAADHVELYRELLDGAGP